MTLQEALNILRNPNEQSIEQLRAAMAVVLQNTLKVPD
jgi:hypothetical protein